MSDNQFKPGDTVRLKSGGPIMTIDSLQSDGTYWCVWFDKNQVQRADAYGGHLLAKVSLTESEAKVWVS